MRAAKIDFSDAGTLAFLKRLGPTGMPIVSMMERHEKWVVDGDDRVEVAMSRLGDALNKADPKQVVAAINDDPEPILKIMALIRSSRSAMLFSWLTALSPTIDSVLFSRCARSSNKYSEVFVMRLRALERLSILARIFSPGRLEMIVGALEAVANDSDKSTHKE